MVIDYRIRPEVSSDEMNALFAASWPAHEQGNLSAHLAFSLTWVCAYDEGRLIGFVNVAWDGGIHAFILDTTVHRDHRRQGIGKQLVEYATHAARDRGIRWLHVDYEPHLREFYSSCGFHPTDAGLMAL